ncbi:MAG: glycosyltransferase family 39 protein [Saprospiraceae bacterium]|nr:glycosyltransferase family 39 protein [Saprospiraceae bacterium]
MIFRYTIRFVLVFFITAWVGGYHSWLQWPPAAIHQWRQADGASLSLQYAIQPNIWKPHVQNLFLSGNPQAVGELPVLYWLSGCYSRFFDTPAYPLRWIGLFFLFWGLWGFGWALLKQTNNPFLAALGAGVLMSSPVLSYYGPNFLPDAPGFCFLLMMISALYRAFERQSLAWLALATIFCTMAVLLKLSMAILPLALATTWCLGLNKHWWNGNRLLNSKFPIWAILGSAVLIMGFRIWISEYNRANEAFYFLTAVRPIWNYDLGFILETLVLWFQTAAPTFGSIGLYAVCGVSLWFLIRYWKSMHHKVKTVLWLSFLGSVAYWLLWFRMFREHDYYMICLLILPVLLILCLTEMAAPKMLLMLFAVAWILGLGHVGWVLKKRAALAVDPANSLTLPVGAFLSKEALTAAGIPDSVRLFCPEDPSPNVALFALKRQGITAYTLGFDPSLDSLVKYQEKLRIDFMALRDTTHYTPELRTCFPNLKTQLSGWYLYKR